VCAAHLQHRSLVWKKLRITSIWIRQIVLTANQVSKNWIYAAFVSSLTIEKIIYLQHLNFCNFTLWMPPCFGCPGPSPRSTPPLLCTPLGEAIGTRPKPEQFFLQESSRWTLFRKERYNDSLRDRSQNNWDTDTLPLSHHRSYAVM